MATRAENNEKLIERAQIQGAITHQHLLDGKSVREISAITGKSITTLTENYRLYRDYIPLHVHRTRRRIGGETIAAAVNDARNHAERKNLDFKIDDAWLQKFPPTRCSATGEKFNLVDKIPALQMIDSSRGYVPGNCVWILKSVRFFIRGLR